MIKRKEDIPVEVRHELRGGKGDVAFHNFMNPEEACNHGRTFSKIVIAPGSSIGTHTHEGEFEAFYILSGVAKVDNNGEEVLLNPGDFHLCKNGETHSVESAGAEDMEMIALIMYSA